MKVALAAYMANPSGRLKGWVKNEYVSAYLTAVQNVKTLNDLKVLKNCYNCIGDMSYSAGLSYNKVLGILYLSITSSSRHKDSIVFYDSFSPEKTLPIFYTADMYNVGADVLKYYLGMSNYTQNGGTSSYASDWTFDPFTGKKKELSDPGPVAHGGYYFKLQTRRVDGEAAYCGSYEDNQNSIMYVLDSFDDKTGNIQITTEEIGNGGPTDLVIPKDWPLNVTYYEQTFSSEVESLITSKAQGVAEQVSTYFVSR